MKQLLATLTLALLATACVSGSFQKPPLPDQAVALTDVSMCRIYVAREGGLYGKRMLVLVYRDAAEVGAIRDGDYLCWEQAPGRITIRSAIEKSELESSFGGLVGESHLVLELKAGDVAYVGAALSMDSKLPTLRRLEVPEAREILRGQSPAPTK